MIGAILKTVFFFISDASNGWFRFLLDGQLSTMYSSGSPETGADSAEKRGEFLDKLTKARSAVPLGSPLLSVLSQPDEEKSVGYLCIPFLCLIFFFCFEILKDNM